MTRKPKVQSAEPEAITPKLVQLPIGELVPNPRNPRTHPAGQLERLMASLQRDGQTKPVLARAENKMLIAGHGITQAALQLGWTSLAVLLWQVDQATADRVMLADNRLGELSASDKDRMAQLLGDISPADYLATGFTEGEVEKLLTDNDEALEVFAIETTAVSDEFWITCRGPLAQQAEVLQRIKTLLGEFPNVSVELGTIQGV